MTDPQSPNQPSMISRWPKSVRLRILWFSVGGLMLFIIGGWLITLQSVINQRQTTDAVSSEQSMNQIQNDLQTLIDKTKTALDASQATTPSTTSELDAQTIEKLKAALGASIEPAIYRNEPFGFAFSYPATITLNPAPTSTDTLYIEFCGHESCPADADFMTVQSTTSTIPVLNYDYAIPGRGTANAGFRAATAIDKKPIFLGGYPGLLVKVNNDQWRWLQVIRDGRLYSFLINYYKNDRLDDYITASFTFIR